MHSNKATYCAAGIGITSAGSLLYYFEKYLNNELLSTISFILIFAGWTVLFFQITKDTIFDAKKISFKQTSIGWFKQKAISFLCTAIYLLVIFSNWFGISELADQRENEILTNTPTNTTKAVVAYMDIRHGRRSTSYYAVFQYTANGKLISHPRYAGSMTDFLVGERYLIKYAVAYPEMFLIERQLPR